MTFEADRICLKKEVQPHELQAKFEADEATEATEATRRHNMYYQTRLMSGDVRRQGAVKWWLEQDGSLPRPVLSAASLALIDDELVLKGEAAGRRHELFQVLRTSEHTLATGDAPHALVSGELAAQRSHGLTVALPIAYSALLRLRDNL